MRLNPALKAATRGSFVLVCLFLAGGRGSAQPAEGSAAAAAIRPLFEEQAPLELTLTMDVREVAGDRSDDPVYAPATLTYRTTGGVEGGVALRVRTRGYYRLHYLDCDIPPLRLNFDEAQVDGSLFAGQDKLKLVTHCQDESERFEQYVLLEYLLYKAYALFTEVSFRVRLARITYADSRGRRDPRTEYAFLIEDEDEMAARNGGVVLDREGLHPEATDREAILRLSIFQYLIGNTDWTVARRHNIRFVFLEEARKIVAVPYDFDWAGLVNTHYATPDPQLRIRSVRERRFMGFCRSAEEVAQVLAQIASQEEALYRLFREAPGLDADTAADAIAYLQEFFGELRDRDALVRALERDCLGRVD